MTVFFKLWLLSLYLLSLVDFFFLYLSVFPKHNKQYHDEGQFHEQWHRELALISAANTNST